MEEHLRPPRRRGRPRSASVDRALLQAALEVFTAHGFQEMSMESIATRAGVSKVSLYRRWSSKNLVAADLLRLMGETAVPEDKSSLEADIRSMFDAAIGSEIARTAAKVLMRTMGEISGNPELLALYREHLLAPRLEQIRSLVERARARNELRTDVPTDVAAAMIAGPLFLYYLTILVEIDGHLPNDLAGQLTRSILEGIGR